MKLSEVFGQIPEAAPKSNELTPDEASYLHYVLAMNAAGENDDSELWVMADEIGLNIDIDQLRWKLHRLSKGAANKTQGP